MPNTPELRRALRQQLYERDRGICQLCSEPVAFDRAMHLDHIHPRILGGSDEASNLRITHARCNIRRRAPGHTRGDGISSPLVVVTVTAQDLRLIDALHQKLGLNQSALMRLGLRRLAEVEGVQDAAPE